MHFGRLFDFATTSSTGALIVLSIACGVVLLGVWVSARRLKRRQMRRELEAERQAAARCIGNDSLNFVATYLRPTLASTVKMVCGHTAADQGSDGRCMRCAVDRFLGRKV